MVVYRKSIGAKKPQAKAPVYKAKVIKQDNSAKVLKMSNKARRSS